jgi:hypothetical protein
MAHTERAILEGRATRSILVVLSPVVQIPVELEKLFTVVQHDLPSRDEIEEIARGVATEDGELPTDPDSLRRLLDASAGLTRLESENAFALSLVRNGCLRPDVIWELKAASLLKSGLLKLHQGQERFADLGGMENLKRFCLQSLREGAKERALGAVLVSPPGCGKSQFCKALGNEVGRPVLTMDVGALLGSLVGQSEGNMRRALAIVDKMSPCVLFLDEVEKGLSGVGSNGDSGVSTRIFGSFLTWLNDHKSDVFVIATSNNIQGLPPEFSRAERFDGVFYVDLPNENQRAAIWSIYRRQYDVSASQPIPSDRDWTGAEIKSCCRLSALLGVPLREAALSVVPVAVRQADKIRQLREWASGFCVSADNPGIYVFDAPKAAGGRAVQRKGKGESSPDVN